MISGGVSESSVVETSEPVGTEGNRSVRGTVRDCGSGVNTGDIASHRGMDSNSGSRVDSDSRGRVDSNSRSRVDSHGSTSNDGSTSENSPTSDHGTSGVDIIGVVNMVRVSSSLDELNGRSGRLSLHNLDNAGSRASRLLDINNLGLGAAHDAFNMSRTGSVLNDTNVVLFAGNLNLSNLGSGLRPLVDTNNLISSLEVFDADGLTSSSSMDFVRTDGGGSSSGDHSDVNGGSSSDSNRGGSIRNSRGGSIRNSRRGSDSVRNGRGGGNHRSSIRNSGSGSVSRIASSVGKSGGSNRGITSAVRDGSV